MTSIGAPVPARPAATLVLLREGDQGVQVLMLARPDTATFAAGALVFPGGSVDAQDRSRAQEGPTDAALRLAAVRECFEECGVLLARDHRGAAPDRHAVREMQRLRAEVATGGPPDFFSQLKTRGLRPDIEGLIFCAHWVTPAWMQRRFDTRFFATALPGGQEAQSDASGESAGWRWVEPSELLREATSGESLVLPPTRAVLSIFQGCQDVPSALAKAALVAVERVEPTREQLSQDRYPGLDMSRVDPEGAA